MNPPPGVSVVIPTRNRAGLVADAVTSLRALSYPDEKYEIVVVDDGSTDKTRAALEGFLDGQLPLVRYVRQTPQGLNAARNHGLREARGEWVVFVDDDVALPSEWLSAYADAFHRYPDVQVFGGPVYTRLEGQQPLPRNCAACEPLTTFDDFVPGEGDQEVPWLPGANMALRREAVERFGWFNEAFTYGGGDETEWQVRVQRGGGQLLCIARAWLWHRRSPDDMRNKLLRRRFLRGKWYIRFLGETGERLPRLGGIALRLVQALGHAARHRCFMGLAKAATELGQVVGWLRWRLARR